MEIPSLARSTPHKSNRNGFSTASYSSSGGNCGVLSWKAHILTTIVLCDSLISPTLLFFLLLSRLLPLFKSCYFSFRGLVVGVWAVYWCQSGASGEALALRIQSDDPRLPSGTSGGCLELVSVALCLEETKARIRRRWQKARCCVGCVCRCMCVSLYLSRNEYQNTLSTSKMRTFWPVRTTSMDCF